MCTKEYNPSLGSWSVGEMFCLKLLPQFLSYLNETCYTWSLWLVYMHYILFLRPGQRVLKLWPLFELLQYSYNLHFLWQSGYRGLLITISESPSLCCACFDNWNSTDNATIVFFIISPPPPIQDEDAHKAWLYLHENDVVAILKQLPLAEIFHHVFFVVQDPVKNGMHSGTFSLMYTLCRVRQKGTFYNIEDTSIKYLVPS